ncbi:hypothetical protein MUU49_14975 [Scandinavium goeteborgense]|uniref:hypothetical protein n=1 Tax=Scandinavium goeteborgense TaxID=1851514 RepID=UPI002165CE93|nr:hypothetical protein [Scandinavium goeteborgense]MCS2153856.1 hypothetical protein [Scandinavium goeteborgense]
MTDGIRPDGEIFASEASDGELENFPSINRGWGVTLDGNDENGDSVTTATNGVPPMEWDNGQRNKVDNNIWWLMQHAIPDWMEGVWSAGAFVRYNSWVYFNSSETATSLSPQEGPEWKTVLPLDEAEGYLQIKNNFSEIAARGSDAQTEARGNIGCGSAALADVVNSMTDQTAGRLPVVGWEGVGGMSIQTTNAELQSQSLTGGRLFKQGGGTGSDRFGGYGCGVHLPYGQNGDGSQQLSANLFIDAHGLLSVEWLAINIADGSIASKYTQQYLSLSGGSMTGEISLPAIGNGSYASQNDLKAPLYQWIDSGQTSEFWPIIKQHYSQGNCTWSAGMTINADDFHIHYIAGNGDAVTFNFGKNGQFIPPNYGNFDAKYQAKGSYYTQSESNARYVQSIQLGSEISVPNSAGLIHAGTGSFWSSVYRDHSDADDLNWYSKPIQKNINGVWTTISG